MITKTSLKNVLNRPKFNTTIINIFNSDNSNITYIKTQHSQIMAIITYIILKFESVVKKTNSDKSCILYFDYF